MRHMRGNNLFLFLPEVSFLSITFRFPFLIFFICLLHAIKNIRPLNRNSPSSNWIDTAPIERHRMETIGDLVSINNSIGDNSIQMISRSKLSKMTKSTTTRGFHVKQLNSHIRFVKCKLGVNRITWHPSAVELTLGYWNGFVANFHRQWKNHEGSIDNFSVI